MKHIEKVTYAEENQQVSPKINSARLDAHGREIIDSRPMAPPIGFVAEESVFDKMRQMMRAASLEAAQAGAETLEEANDFYVEDDPQSALPPSEYEFDEDHQVELEKFIKAQKQPPQASSRIAGEESPGEAETPPRTPPKGKKPPPPEPLGGSEGGE